MPQKGKNCIKELLQIIAVVKKKSVIIFAVIFLKHYFVSP